MALHDNSRQHVKPCLNWGGAPMAFLAYAYLHHIRAKNTSLHLIRAKELRLLRESDTKKKANFVPI
jgi:hypothetical protein